MLRTLFKKLLNRFGVGGEKDIARQFHFTERLKFMDGENRTTDRSAFDQLRCHMFGAARQLPPMSLELVIGGTIQDHSDRSLSVVLQQQYDCLDKLPFGQLFTGDQ